jgi:hypothetical protein
MYHRPLVSLVQGIARGFVSYIFHFNGNKLGRQRSRFIRILYSGLPGDDSIKDLKKRVNFRFSSCKKAPYLLHFLSAGLIIYRVKKIM